ncbi:O-antigen ligase family protein [Novipirellula sp. SH528]|uniref:O-antigen ligase family protein n=1 Tax=Novipirellula sp. SH528 TaxID=3454466 RepID=UPI003FA00AA2
MTQPRLGYLYVLSLPICAAIATPRGLEIAGQNYTGWLWLGLLVLGVLLMLIDKAIFGDQRWVRFPVIPWVAFFGFNWISLLWADDFGSRNIQDAMQVSMPLIAGAAASMFIETNAQLRTLQRIFLFSMLPLLVSLIIWRLDLMPSLDFDTGMRPLGLTVGLVGCVMLAMAPPRYLFAFAGWGASLAICFASGGRTVTLSILALPMLHPRMGTKLGRVALCAVMLVLAVAVFHSETFQQRFFYSGHGTLEDLMAGDVRGSGRFDAWPKIFDHAMLTPWLGHGIGSAYDYVAIVWPGMNHVQNDYLRVFYETGVVGFTIFVFVAIWQTISLFLRVRSSTGLVQQTYLAAWLGWLLFLINATTGNPISYNLWFMNPLFVLMGAAYGVDALQRDESSPNTIDPSDDPYLHD